MGRMHFKAQYSFYSAGWDLCEQMLFQMVYRRNGNQLNCAAELDFTLVTGILLL